MPSSQTPDNGMDRIVRTQEGMVATKRDTPVTTGVPGQSQTYFVPRLELETSVPLRWGEWFAIALFNTGAMALAIETVLRVMATVWFASPARALLPLGPLWLTLLAAALVSRAGVVVPALRPLTRGIAALGIVATALILIRIQVFPHVQGWDLRWLGALGDLTSLDAEQPHAELGLMALSVIIWLLVSGVARNGGELTLRRANFLGFFGLMIGAVVLDVLAQRGDASQYSFIALALPFYVLGGLLMLAQVRLAEMRARTARSGVAMGRARWIWRAVTTGLAIFTLAIVFIATAAFYGDSYGQLIAGINAAWTGTITVIATVVSFILAPFAAFLVIFANRPRSSTHTTTTKKPAPLPDSGQHVSAATTHATYIIFLIIVAIIIVLVVTYRAWRALKESDEESFAETRERLAPKSVARVAPPQPFVTTAPPSAGSVRVVYRTLLRRMAKVGLTRDPDETPTEYAARLSPHLGSAPTDDPITALDDLTTEYQNERYGGTAPTPSLFARAQAALRRLLGHGSD